MSGNAFVSETAGALTAWTPEEVRTGGTYRITYRVTRESFTMEACSRAPCRLLFPVRTAVADDVVCESSAELRLEDTARHGEAFSPIGGLLMRYGALWPNRDGNCTLSVK